MKLVFLSLVFTMVSVATAAQPDQNADLDTLRRCRSFQECMLVWGGCSDAAINKNYVSQFKPSMACLASAPHNPKAVPTCREGFCIVVIPDEKK